MLFSKLKRSISEEKGGRHMWIPIAVNPTNYVLTVAQILGYCSYIHDDSWFHCKIVQDFYLFTYVLYISFQSVFVEPHEFPVPRL